MEKSHYHPVQQLHRPSVAFLITLDCYRPHKRISLLGIGNRRDCRAGELVLQEFCLKKREKGSLGTE
jgi:hypothetical protein